MVGSPYLPSALSALGSSCVNWESNSSFPQKPTTKVLIRESHFAVAKSSHLSLSSTGSFGFRHLDFCEQRTALHKPSCETDKDLLRISTRMKPQPTTLRRKSGSHSTYIFKGCLKKRDPCSYRCIRRMCWISSTAQHTKLTGYRSLPGINAKHTNGRRIRYSIPPDNATWILSVCNPIWILWKARYQKIRLPRYFPQVRIRKSSSHVKCKLRWSYASRFSSYLTLPQFFVS